MRLSQQLGDTLRESGLTAAEKKAGRVDARKMSMKEVLSLLADGKEVVVTKKVADKVPSILVKHGIYIRSFRAGPRKEWEGVALITKDQKKLDSLRASLKEEREERALSNVKKKMAPHMIVISKDSAGNFIVSRGDPFKGSSKLLAREKTKADIKLWALDNLGGKYGVYSHDHVLDMTGLKLSPPFFSQWYVDNIMKKEGLGEEVIPGLGKLKESSWEASKIEEVVVEIEEIIDGMGGKYPSVTKPLKMALRYAKQAEKAAEEL